MESITRADLLAIGGESVSIADGRVRLELPPYAIAVLNGERG